MNQSTNIADLQKQSGGKKPQNFPAMLKASFAEVARALPKHLNPDRMSRIALTAFRRNPNLAKCDPRSVIAAVIQASQLGLEIDTLGRAYLVPYKGECQFIPGWKGLVELLNRSGQGTAWTGAVFEGDEFEYTLGDSPFIRHKPLGEYGDDKLTHVYAVGRPKSSDWPIIEVWKMDRVVKHRDRYNKVGNSHYSFKNMEMYARKVVLLQVLKYMPMSPELVTVMELDQASQTSGQHLDVKEAIDGTWSPVAEQEPATDSQGEIFDPEKHIAFDKFNQDGSFTKRKVRSSKPKEEKPVEKKHVNFIQQFIDKMKEATNIDELSSARELANDPDHELTEDESINLDGIYHSLESKLKDGGENTEGNGSAGNFENMD